MSLKCVPTDYTYSKGDVMSNFDHIIRPDGDKLKELKVIAGYSAWDFRGYVWYEDMKYHCEIWQYHRHVDTISADTLQDIMDIACDKYGDK